MERFGRRFATFAKALLYVKGLAVVVAVAVPVHYLGALDWPWAIVIGAAASIVLRRLIHVRPRRV